MKQFLQEDITFRFNPQNIYPYVRRQITSALAINPTMYDGKMTWDAYRTQFELLNRWNDVQKATILAVNIRGPAAAVFTNLPSKNRQKFEVLTAALERQFGSAYQTKHRLGQERTTRKRPCQNLQKM